MKIRGIKVGSVTKLTITPETYLAKIEVLLNKDIKLPVDTMALISAEVLMGGQSAHLQPGGGEDLITPGGDITYARNAKDTVELIDQIVIVQETETRNPTDGI
ncbi:MAG: hypothetical protein CMM33_08365 [Rhodospirillaceae bacterium]|nr:hypothetical protein [Rhodospirillaceae bacterium]